MSRIGPRFDGLRHREQVGLVAYITVGYPDPGSTPDLVRALVDGGADFVELGVPFSDPLADGATIQRASFQALEKGVTLGHCLDLAAKLRVEGLEVPFILMGYYNPFYRYGLERLTRECQEAGVDGLIIPDLPPEEAEELRGLCDGYSLDLIFMLAPTSTEGRISRVCKRATGFVYCVSLTGTTGARSRLSTALPPFISRVRRYTTLPLAIGFGISTRDHVAEVARLAEAAVVGSALIDLIDGVPGPERAGALAQFVRGLKGTSAR